MSVKKRREEILQLLTESPGPVSGNRLAERFGVSRQIIVRDMNGLKEEGHDILATARGYLLLAEPEVTRVFKVRHGVEDTERELTLIIDQGARVRDVFIFHKIYGELHGPLNISSRRDIAEFCRNIRTGKSSPLSTVTSGYHYHTVAAPDTETLDRVETELKSAGFLAGLTDYEPEGIFRKE